MQRSEAEIVSTGQLLPTKRGYRYIAGGPVENTSRAWGGERQRDGGNHGSLAPPSQWLPISIRDTSEREYDRQSLISSFKVVAADALRAYYPRPDVCGPSDPKLAEYHNPTWKDRNCSFQLAENYIGHQQSPPPPPSTTLDHPPIRSPSSMALPLRCPSSNHAP
jgi:hypothetical protein